MKKELLMAAVMGSLILLCGCGLKLSEEYTEEVNTLEGAELKVDEDSVKPTEITYTISNQSDAGLSYGQSYGLQKEKNGKWYPVIPKNEVAITSEMLWIPAGSTDTLMTGWESSYGKLPKGHYRIVKHVYDEQQEYILAGEFEIEKKEGEKDMGARYEFQTESMEILKEKMSGTSKIRNIVEGYGEEAYYQGILCLGQLKTLFGEPLYITEDLENQYAYCISAANESGKKVYLQVYSGPSGPAIGGNMDGDSRQAADELAGLITGAEPEDYDYEGYYMDGPSAVKMGVRNGEPYMEEKEISEEEFAELCKKLYGLEE